MENRGPIDPGSNLSSGNRMPSYPQDPNRDPNSYRGTTMTAMFRNREDAESAYRTLHNRGYNKDDVNVIMTDDARKRHFGNNPDSELGDKAMEGAGAGSAIGGTLGAIAGAIAAIGTSVALPGLGLVVAGPVAAAFAGAGAGGLTGGLIGALVGAGIPEDRAKEYESGVKEGNIVLGVQPRDEAEARYIEDEWRRAGAENIHY